MNLPKSRLVVIAAFASTLGVIALSGCDSCKNEDEEKSKIPPVVTCGPGTIAQGNQCVGTIPQTIPQTVPR